MKIKILAIAALAAIMGACGSDEPKPSINDDDVVHVKEEADRTVLIGTEDGKVYNMKDGSVYSPLTGCEWVNNMAMHGEDYYVAGYGSTLGGFYWHNGEPVSLDVAIHETYDIARSYDHVYVLADAGEVGYGVYRDGTLVAQTSEAQLSALAVYADKFYAVGSKRETVPALFTNNGVVELSNGGYPTVATSIDLVANSQNVTHYIAGYHSQTVDGVALRIPCLWRNGTLSTLPLNFTDSEKNRNTYRSGMANDVAHSGQIIYTVGYRTDGHNHRATVWITSTSDDDQVRTYWQADGNVEAQAVRVLVYGSDIYVMTLEHNLDTDAWCTRVWMNHTLKGTVNGIIGNAFVVI